MEWYEQRFVNHRDWVLDNLNLLGLNAQETVMVLMIDFMNEHHMPITQETLGKRVGLNPGETDQILALLCAKKYLDITARAADIVFSLDGMFRTDTARSASLLDASLIDTFETEFGKTLSANEMEKLSELNRTTDKKLILYALRESCAYQKCSIGYVETVLAEWKKKGITVEKIEAGILKGM